MAQQDPDSHGNGLREIDDSTPLHRQLVHNWIRNGRITSVRFTTAILRLSTSRCPFLLMPAIHSETTLLGGWRQKQY